MNGSSKNDNSKIVGFDDEDLDTIINGSFDTVFNEGYMFKGTGKVVNTDTNDILCEEITPMVMLINQSRQGFIETLRTYIKGDDQRYNDEFERKINYYGRTTTAREIAEKYRGY
tara:strand:- start:8701 stop:9042 length:342 start_codon:yes stop_codon:yes gene_type:complete